MNNSTSIPKVKITQEDELNDINMADANKKPSGQLPPAVTYNNPRRTSPENSITLRHHRMAREASKRNAIANAAAQSSIVLSPRRNSSDESNDTGLSDPRRWFDRSNRNLPTTLDSSLDIDPPFYQKETDSSNEEGHMVPSHSPAYRYVQHHNPGLLRPGMTHSSSADDYRSVIDDLTVENKRLKEELKRYRQMGPDSLRREKLFEVKVHGLPSRKKRELEAALRDFTTSLDGSSNGASPQRKKEQTRGSKGMDSVMSKHASSSSGSNSRPNQTDSAYASMSTGAGSSGPSLPSRLSRQKSDNTVERYLQDIPEGLLPRFGALTEKEKKKLVVRRLEQIFTGKGLGHTRHNSLSLVPPPAIEDVEMSGTSDNKLQPLPPPEASREAHILPRSKRASHSRDDVSPDSNDDRTQSRDMGDVSGSGSGRTQQEDDLAPQSLGTGDQRPTRPHDLDPDRPSVPSENMDYIRHLGLAAPESRRFSSKDVSSDAEGWVYLNLLCNMAQLHMFNVTPAFIRSAVSEKSRQFQLSSDGRKIRWRGGGEGTRFSSDSSGTNSRHGGSSPDTDGSNEFDQRKRQKAQPSGEEVIVSEPSKFEPQRSSSSDEFHYKPMFAHHHTSSSGEQASIAEETLSSVGPPEESNLGINSRWNQSGVSRVSQRKRRRDGAIIYYTGAPFCTDLSGDFGNDSHDTNSRPQSPGPELNRSGSSSSIPFKPLSNFMSLRSMMDLDFTDQDAVSDSSVSSDEIQGDFPWSNSKQSAKLLNLEASGIGGITPDDHFVMVVSTSRPRSPKDQEGFQQPTLAKGASEETVISKDTTESIVGRLASMSTSSPLPVQFFSTGKTNPRIDIEYIGGKVRRLPSAPLPPPSFFFGDTSSSFETTTSDSESDDDEEEPSHQSRAYSANGELSSNDEEDEDTDHDGDCDESDSIPPAKSGLSKLTGSSVATAGGAASGYSSMVES
ncbi:putative Frequency clock protein [Seiridium cardinale]